MKLKLYSTYIVAFLLIACTTQYNLHSHTEKSMDVKAEEDSIISAMISPYKAGIDSIMNEVLCISSDKMTKGQPESLLGNFVTDLCLEKFSSQADICVLNNGGLRSVLPKDKITRRDIFKLMPFENELVILELDILDYNELLQYITHRGGEPFAGVQIVMDKDGKIVNQSLEIKNGVVKVLTSDYLANGGDNMSFFQNKNQKKIGLKLRDTILNYCSAKDTITSKLDNRLSYE